MKTLIYTPIDGAPTFCTNLTDAQKQTISDGDATCLQIETTDAPTIHDVMYSEGEESLLPLEAYSEDPESIEDEPVPASA